MKQRNWRRIILTVVVMALSALPLMYSIDNQVPESVYTMSAWLFILVTAIGFGVIVDAWVVEKSDDTQSGKQNPRDYSKISQGHGRKPLPKFSSEGIITARVTDPVQPSRYFVMIEDDSRSPTLVRRLDCDENEPQNFQVGDIVQFHHDLKNPDALEDILTVHPAKKR